MKRSIVLASVLLLAGALAAQAAGRDDETVSKFCRDRGDFGLSHGACVAQFTAGNTTPHNADVCKMAWVRAWVRAENEGECVTALNAMSR